MIGFCCSSGRTKLKKKIKKRRASETDKQLPTYAYHLPPTNRQLPSSIVHGLPRPGRPKGFLGTSQKDTTECPKMLFIQFRLQYPTEPNNCDLASLQKSSQNVPQIGPKILPKMLPNRSIPEAPGFKQWGFSQE